MVYHTNPDSEHYHLMRGERFDDTVHDKKEGEMTRVGELHEPLYQNSTEYRTGHLVYHINPDWRPA